MPCILLSAAGAVVLLVYIREKIRAYSLKAVFIKSVVSALFTAVGLYGMYAAAKSGKPSLTGVLVLLGLLCGLLGDLWLDFKYVFPAHNDAFTYAGMGAFGIGHLFYGAGLLLRFYPQGKPLYVVLPILLGACGSGLNLLLEKPMRLHYGKWKPIVFAYGVMLFSVVLLSGSLALCFRLREPALNMFFAGAVLFAVSDVILSGTYWGQGKERPIDIALNYLTYYPAQFLIASSLLFI